MPYQGMRRLMAGAVFIVAAIAAVVSYIHVQHLASTRGQEWLTAMLIPLSIDGTITAASLALLYAARAGLPSPWLARVMLALGVLATIAANAIEGAAGGVVGILVSAWPAIAFIGGIELLIWAARNAQPAVAEAAPGQVQPIALASASEDAQPRRTGKVKPSASGRPTPADAERRYAPQLATGDLPSMRAIQREMRVGQRTAQALRAHLASLGRAA